MRRVCNGWNEGDPVPDELHAVSWCDGDYSNIQTIIDEHGQELEVAEKIISNKHSAAKTTGK